MHVGDLAQWQEEKCALWDLGKHFHRAMIARLRLEFEISGHRLATRRPFLSASCPISSYGNETAQSDGTFTHMRLKIEEEGSQK